MWLSHWNKLALLFLLIPSLVCGQPTTGGSGPTVSGGTVTVSEEDGSPSAVPTTIKFANGTVTDNGDGSVSVSAAAGQAIIFDIGDDGGNDSTDVGEIATSGDTNSIFTEPSADKILIDLSQNWPTCDSADAVGNDAVTMATDTTGNFVATITAGAGLSSTGATTGENISHTLSTASSEADFLASGALTCGASTQGKVQVHTTPLQYCDNAATPALQYAAYGASDGDALAGDSATSFFDTGTIEHERGGLEADVSGYTDGLYGQASGATINVNTEAELETALGGLDVVTVTASDISSANLATALSDETGSGVAVFGTSPVLTTATLTNPRLGASTSALTITVTNEAVTGTSNNHLAKLSGAPSTAIITSAGDTSGAVGIVISGGGATGSAIIAVIGTADCDFDGATTAGNYAQISGSVDGECTDAGSSYPSTGQTIGRILETQGAAGVVAVALGGENIGVGAAGGLGTNLSSSTIDILTDNDDIQLGGTGATNNEKLTFDFETTANQVSVSTSTGVTAIDFGSMQLAAGSFDSDPSATPSLDARDSDMGGTPDINMQVLGNCTNGSTAGGDEDCDIDLKVQAGGNAAATGFKLSGQSDGTILADISGSSAVEIPNTNSGDVALTTEGQMAFKSDEDLIAMHGGSAGEAQGEFGFSVLQHIVLVFDPAWAYDQESTNHSMPIMVVGDDFPHGFTMTEWLVNYVAGDPTTELDADIICDTSPDYATGAAATVMDVIDTTAGTATADASFDSATCANGAYMYVHFGADPADANVLVTLDIWGYAEED